MNINRRSYTPASLDIEDDQYPTASSTLSSLTSVSPPVPMTLALTLSPSHLPIQTHTHESVSVLSSRCKSLLRLSPMIECKLFHMGARLISENSLCDYQVMDGDTLEVCEVNLLWEMNVYVKTGTGRVLAVRITRKSSVMDVKKEISVKAGVAVRCQRLKYANKELKNDQLLIDYGIQRESTLYLDEASVSLSALCSGQFPLSPVSSRRPPQPNLFSVRISTADRQPIEINVESTDTIRTVKLITEELIRVPSDCQMVMYQGTVLEADRTVEECGLHAGGEVFVTCAKIGEFRLFVRAPTDQILTFDVTGGDSIQTVKSLIAAKEAIPACVQSLIFADQVLGDGFTLNECNVTKGSVLHLSLSEQYFPIILNLPGGTLHTVYVCKSDSVAEIKHRIEVKTEIATQEQVLIFNEIELQNEDSMKKYNIPTQGQVTLLQKQPNWISLFVKTHKGRTVQIKVKKSDCVDAIKAEIERKEGIPPDQQVLKHEMKLLVDGTPLANYNIDKDSNIVMSLRLLGGASASFAFNSLETMINLRWSRTAPEYRTVAKGVSFKSTCLNPACDAFNRVVYIAKGFGHFNVAREACNLQCPLCEVESKPSMNCGFYKARWRFEGKSENGGSYVQDGVSDVDSFQEFKEGEHTVWIYLEVEVQPLGVLCA